MFGVCIIVVIVVKYIWQVDTTLAFMQKYMVFEAKIHSAIVFRWNISLSAVKQKKAQNRSPAFSSGTFFL